MPSSGPTLQTIEGAVFDLDGTLVDNMPFHIEAFGAFAENHGLPPLTLERRKWMDGKRNADIFPGLFGRQLSPAEIAAMADEKESMYRRISAGRLTPLRGLIRLLDLLEHARVPVAVATSAPQENVTHTLGELGLADRFRMVARSDEVPRGKPEPDVFLEAARLMKAAPERCLAFEDAPAGIIAARRAGMVTVAVATSYPREVLAVTDPPPHYVVADFDEFLEGDGAWVASLLQESRVAS
ncbi:MAG TPA: HAD family phosphatase [Vicinamibacterales bacterium]